MFCYQCEQTSKGTGCTKLGVCGKQPEVAALQDLLTHALKGTALYAVEGRKVGVNDQDANRFTAWGLFATLTNVNFDAQDFVGFINRAVELRDGLKEKVKAAGGNVDFAQDCANFTLETTLDGLVKQGEAVMEVVPDPAINPDIQSLQDIVRFGARGVATYAYHAEVLGEEDDSIYEYLHDALAKIAKNEGSLEDWIGMTLKCGEVNLTTMGLLDKANTETYGHPVPTKVPLGAKAGKAILVSGHDLKDLAEILKQTEGKGINVYPGLKKYAHFYGHYGTAWQNQQKEFPEFPGAIVMTTNCIQKPRETYLDNIYTTGPVGWPGARHIADGDYTPAIEKALAMPGFAEDVAGKEVMVGFARNAVLGVAGQVIEAVKNKDIRHFFLVGGCDGAKPGRSYYTEFVEKVPDDCIVLTLACGKFRFFDKDLGDIGGIPRLLDVGQCNDAYSAIQIAGALADAFGVSVNELPLSMVLSWYEQKAVAILLSLLHLGIKDIRLGPSLPAFITPNVLDVLVKNFDIKPISTPDEDLKAILG
jgi:hydroxylamine reductase